MRLVRIFVPSLALLLAALTLPSASLARESMGQGPGATPLASVEEKPTEGRPTVVLDQLEFPRDLQGASGFEKHLKRALKREARRADWGAGRDNRIEYRFSVTELSFKLNDGVLSVRCAATGKLPGGQRARSDLSFSGHPGERDKLTRKVLEIVGRGVITRLAELERRRRGLR